MSRLWCVLWFFAVLLILPACATTGNRFWVPAVDRHKDLPAESAALIELSDQEIAHTPPTPDRVDRAMAALEATLARGDAPSFDVHWRMARACFKMTELLTNSSQQRAYADVGVENARQAAEVANDRVEGHYYLALNRVKLAEATTDVAILRAVMKEAEKAIQIDAAYDGAGPLRLAGKIYMVAPEWPAGLGDRDKAVEVLKQALIKSPSPMNRLFLGQALFHIDEFSGAKAHIKRALKEGLASQLDERWLDEARDYLRRMGGDALSYP
jgi:tetratricopeptide (TPR) repeat protein